MAQITYKSAGITANDMGVISTPLATLSSTPAVVIGTSKKGPAFSPWSFTTKKDFEDRFGIAYVTGSFESITPVDRYTTYGPLAINEWLNNSTAATFIRVLGVGNGKRRVQIGSNAGDVTNAGFTVGEQQPVRLNSGSLGANPFANANGALGRTYFLGCFMSESQGSTVFSSAGLQGTGSVNNIVSTAVPIIRGILMAPSGVILRLSSSGGGYDSSSPPSTLIGNDSTAHGTSLGSVKLFDPEQNNRPLQEFTLLLNGHKGSNEHPNAIVASFDLESPLYISKVFNLSASLMQEAGHYLAAHWDIHPSTAILTGTGVVAAGADAPDDSNRVRSTERSVFIITSSLSRDIGSSTIPNYEGFRDRFSNASSPWIISQKFQGKPINLFKLHALDSGADVANKYKFIIDNITPADSDALYQYGKFDLTIRLLSDELTFYTSSLERHVELTLDPSSPRYISKIIGDKYTYFDFDRPDNEQKLVVEGNYDNFSRYVRVEVSPEVNEKKLPKSALPMGFRGMAHLVTSGSSPLATLNVADASALSVSNFLRNAIVPPVPLSENIRVFVNNSPTTTTSRRWGIKLDHITDLDDHNLTTAIFNESIDGFIKHFPNHSVNNVNFSVSDNTGASDTTQLGIIDADRFCNNLFTLENVKVITGSKNEITPDNWALASYVRNGVVTNNEEEKTRRITVKDFTSANRNYLSFQFVLQGGFDGVNIFDKDEFNLSNAAATADMLDDNRGRSDGSTMATYLSALKVISDTSTVDMQLLAMPGIREPAITNAAAEIAEQRFDTLYLMDIEQLSNDEDLIEISRSQYYDDSLIPNVSLTSNRFTSRYVRSTFTAAYFPDVDMSIPTSLYGVDHVEVPPSVVVLGAISLNDSIGQPWFSPAGIIRGALKSTLTTTVKLDEEKRNLLYSGSINPIWSPGNVGNQGSGVIIGGQKTLGSKNTLLNRINVRRLLLEIRRGIRDIATRLVFQSGRQNVINVLQGRITQLLLEIQRNTGLQEFRVDVDPTLSTQTDIDNGTIRARVYIRPINSDEFASVDVTVGTGNDSET